MINIKQGNKKKLMLKNYQKKITKRLKKIKEKEKNKIKNNFLPDDENKETSSKKITKKEIKLRITSLS